MPNIDSRPDVEMVAAAETRGVYIIGPRNLQNQLLAYYLEKETGCRCRSAHDQEELRKEAAKWKDSHVILRDSAGMDPLNPWFGLGIGAKSNNPKCFLVLFNLPPNQGLEKRIAELGVKGIFYESDPLSRFRKGIPAILQGELWFSRDVMIQSFVKPAERSLSNSDSSLTKREKEILLLIAAGASNDDVAKELFISLHTVKNHVSRIYNKLHVDNRLQAALWAASHL
jgi:DNA-binding NarL/FixJ family response regulator